MREETRTHLSTSHGQRSTDGVWVGCFRTAGLWRWGTDVVIVEVDHYQYHHSQDGIVFWLRKEQTKKTKKSKLITVNNKS